jgi:hypothetical protein
MIGYALQLGTNAAAETMVQLAGLGTRQARVFQNLIRIPFSAIDAAVEAAFGMRGKRAERSDLRAEPRRIEEVRCPEAEVLAAYTDHGLTPEERGSVESHLVECDCCRTRIAFAVSFPPPELPPCTAYRA